MNTTIRALFRRIAYAWKRRVAIFRGHRWPAIDYPVDCSANWKGGRYLPLEQDERYQRFMNA